MVLSDTAFLVERARKGDRLAYGELVERFQPTVYALALSRLRNVAEAQELTQEVFIHAMLKLDQLRDVACFAGWLRQITVRMALNRLTRQGPLRTVDDEVLESARAASQTPLDEIVRSEQQQEVWTGLNRLKPVDRATLVAFYIRGKSLKQMSREFETPIGTIKRRLHIARKRLRRQMEKKASPRQEARPVSRPRPPRRELELALV
jgi:RNA polymerase sigma-70 factor (ECF subfamily)